MDTNSHELNRQTNSCPFVVPDREHGEYGALSQVNCCTATVMTEVGMKRLLGFAGPYFRYASNGSGRAVRIVLTSHSA
jgi:hypothetical protein